MRACDSGAGVVAGAAGWPRARRHARHGAALASLLAALATPSVASATSYEALFFGGASAGYSAYQQTTPSQDVPSPITSVPYLAATGSAALEIETALSRHVLSYALFAPIPFAESTPFSFELFTHRASYQWSRAFGERNALSVQLGGSIAPFVSPFPAQSASATPVQAVPEESGYSIQVTGNETFSRELAEEVRFVQSTTLGHTVPMSSQRDLGYTLTIGESLALSKAWTRDSLTGTVALAHTRFGVTEDAGPGGFRDVQSNLVGTLTAGWSRQFSDALTGGIDAGALVAKQLTLDARTFEPLPADLRPTGSARLAYRIWSANAALSYSYTTLVNPLIVSMGYGHQASLTVSTPIADLGVFVSGTAGYSYVTAAFGVDPTSGTSPTAETLQPDTDVWLADAAIRYVPELLPALNVNLRGSFMRQRPIGQEDRTVTRLGAQLSLTYTFGSARALQAAPISIPSTYSTSPSLGIEVFDTSAQQQAEDAAAAESVPDEPRATKPVEPVEAP